MAEFIEPDDVIEQLLPDADEAEEADAEFEALEDSLASDELIVTEADPPPLGRSWAFDFEQGRFLLDAQRGPLETRDTDTLRFWIEKCLRTDRNATAVSPDGYGLERATDPIGQQFSLNIAHDLEQRVRAALLFHPRIGKVVDFETAFDDQDDQLAVSFTVVLDDGTAVPVADLDLLT